MKIEIEQIDNGYIMTILTSLGGKSTYCFYELEELFFKLSSIYRHDEGEE